VCDARLCPQRFTRLSWITLGWIKFLSIPCENEWRKVVDVRNTQLNPVFLCVQLENHFSRDLDAARQRKGLWIACNLPGEFQVSGDFSKSVKGSMIASQVNLCFMDLDFSLNHLTACDESGNASNFCGWIFSFFYPSFYLTIGLFHYINNVTLTQLLHYERNFFHP
jgi:hypothetical protein